MPPVDVVVRRAEEKDAVSILDMARELAAAVEDPAPRIDVARLVGDLLDDARWGECFIAERGGAPAAYALACRSFEIHTGQRRLWLGDLYVRPEARRSGIGRTLIAAIARHALNLGCTAVYWELWRKNRVGESFYRELGAESAAEMSVLRLRAGRLAELAYERQRGA
jgi:GNAT superfamily N-acetyltransferase